MTAGEVPSQTVGPFFAIGLPWDDGPLAVAADAPGAIWVRGRVLDGAGEPIPDALVETWQTSPEVSNGFRAFTRCPTNSDGRYAIRTLKPGPDADGQAPHLAVSVFARGLLNRVVTRIYFDDETQANAADPVLSAAGDRHGTLIAQSTSDGYIFDIRLQGADETVFLAI
jgi:protocatechuate 3,4-dioxygenase alpha subunit